jgi:hypothetical protein
MNMPCFIVGTGREFDRCPFSLLNSPQGVLHRIKLHALQTEEAVPNPANTLVGQHCPGAARDRAESQVDLKPGQACNGRWATIQTE